MKRPDNLSTGHGWRGRSLTHERPTESRRPLRWQAVCVQCGTVLAEFSRRIKLETRRSRGPRKKAKTIARKMNCPACSAPRWPINEDLLGPESDAYFLRRIGSSPQAPNRCAWMDEIIHGDAVQVMQAMPPACVHLTVTSPPYGGLRKYKGFGFDVRATVNELHRVTRRGGLVCWVVGDETIKGAKSAEPFKQVLAFLAEGFRLHDTLHFVKDAWGFPHASRYYPAHEYVFVFSKGRPAVFNAICDRPNRNAGQMKRSVHQRQKDGSVHRRAKELVIADLGRRTNVWSYSVGFAKSTTDKIAYEHPAIMPEALARDLILSFSNPGQLVLDPFVGSGTTCKMAEIEGRRWLGIEVSDEYCAIARERMGQYLGHSSTT